MLKDFDPTVLGCQETYLKPNNIIEFRKYLSYHVHSEGVDGRACGGVSVLVKKLSHIDRFPSILIYRLWQLHCHSIKLLQYAPYIYHHDINLATENLMICWTNYHLHLF